MNPDSCQCVCTGDYPHLTTETPRAQRKHKNILSQPIFRILTQPICVFFKKRGKKPGFF
ncbi:MAG: hypothetical protein DRJ03_14115 [Chloroflexi bacterium]|nr:MAG: hypothetical protein DRJ03_14115 [Chloroflexota bacterium]